jgi:demethylmenaquinone methyltransferase/2-methoxy-6-polyprenyl-1,4-benzoquinol methylase
VSKNSGMIEAIAPTTSIRRAYNLHSLYYGAIVAPLERRARALALERACVGADERVLEVAVGPGFTLLELLKIVRPTNVVEGVDLSPRMLERARRSIRATGRTNFSLREADARRLPFEEATFDVLVNNYMLDLIPLDDMPIVLNEFRRVLKPGGRLVLVNMSKPNAAAVTWLEKVYRLLPERWVPYLMGGCRPVLMEEPVLQAGFKDVFRQYLPKPMPSEVITAVVP